MWWRKSRFNRIEKKLDCLAEIAEQTHRYLHGFIQTSEEKESTSQVNYEQEQEKIQNRLTQIEDTLNGLTEINQLSHAHLNLLMEAYQTQETTPKVN